MFTYLHLFELHLCMDFRIHVKAKKSEFEITHQDNLLSVGSCFSENIGAKLKNSGFNVNVNPFGVIFNPISISTILKDVFLRRKFTSSDLYEYQSKYYSLQHHGSFKSVNKKELIDRLNSTNTEIYSNINPTSTLIITFGSAWVYELNETNEIVANCHKLPNNIFTKRLLTVDEILAAYQQILPKFKHVILTVSPVRHWKDGAVENTRSKSVLHLAIQRLEEQFSNVTYFPSYEIVVDELRDYRFFKEDMLHPNEQAINYVWEKFQDVYFSEKTLQINRKVEQFNKLRNHRVIDGDEDLIKQHQSKLEEEFKKVKEVLPYFT